MADDVAEKEIATADYAALVEAHLEAVGTDGIVAIPITAARVADAVRASGRNADEVLGAFPGGENITVGDLADVAMLAGCEPRYMTLLIAALDAIVAPDFPSSLLLQSRDGYFLYLIVNGPIRHVLELNCRPNVFGPGFRANATIGRALHLALMRFGKADPKQSTLGNAYKFSCVLGEDEEHSPWPSLATSLGWNADDNVVTVMVGSQTKGFSHQLSPRPEHLLDTYAEEVSTVTQFDPLDIAVPAGFARKAVIVLAEDHRGYMRDAGWSREMMQSRLHQVTCRLASDIRAAGCRADPRLAGKGADETVSIYDGPQDFLIVSAGSGGGRAAVGAVAGLATRRIEEPATPALPVAQPQQVPRTLDEFADAVSYFMNQGMTDGWPIIPPDPEIVGRFVSASMREAEEPLGSAQWRSGPISVQDLAINAVMAGCKPDYMPLLCSIYELLFQPNQQVVAGLAASTMGYNAWYVVHGPVARQLGLNAGGGLFGPGARANVAIGRAIRLGMMNLASLKPNLVDRACLGQAFKYGAVIAEDEQVSPWGPLHASLGFGADESVVTMSWGAHPRVTFNSEATEPTQLLRAIAEDLSVVANFDSPMARGPAGGTLGTTEEDPGASMRSRERLVVMSEGHRRILSSAGWTRAQAQQFLYERCQRKAGDARAKGYETSPYVWPEMPDAERIPLVRSPENFHFLFAGGTGDATMTVSSIITSRRVGDRSPDANVARIVPT